MASQPPPVTRRMIRFSQPQLGTTDTALTKYTPRFRVPGTLKNGEGKSSAANVIIFVALHLMLHGGGVQPAWNTKLESQRKMFIQSSDTDISALEPQ